MNANPAKSLFIFNLLHRKSVICLGNRLTYIHCSKKKNCSVRHAKPAITVTKGKFKYNNINQEVSGYGTEEKEKKFSSYLSSNRHDPDSFGTLSEDWKLEQELKNMPEEEDDIVVTEFTNDSERKIRLTTNQYGRIIKKFLNEKKVGQAIEVLETRMLKEDRVKPENYIYNLLIGACGKVGYTKKAFNLYKKMRDSGVAVTGHTYTGLFNACANSPYRKDGLQRASKLRAKLVENGFLMNQILYHTMIKAFGRCGDMETAFLLVDEMIDKKIRVSGETFNFLLQACITDREEGFKQALLVWRKMLEKRVRPDLFSFNLLLRCSRDCRMGDATSTTQVIQVLLQAGQNDQSRLRLSDPARQEESQLRPVTSSQNVPDLISPQPSMGDVMLVKDITLPEHRLMLMGGSHGVIRLMDMFKVKPDIKTFTQLLDQIPSTLSAEIELLEQMKKKKVPIDCDFCNMLIRKRAFRGDYENAKQTLRLLQERNLQPNIMTFGVLALACQDLSSARQLLADIDKLGFRPNIEILGTLVKNACYNRDCDFIIEIMKVVEKEDLKPCEQFLNHLDNFYRDAKSILKKTLTDDTGVLNSEKFAEFCEIYHVWRKEMKPDDPPHPWEQFRNVAFEPDDLELMKYGKVKYAK